MRRRPKVSRRQRANSAQARSNPLAFARFENIKRSALRRGLQCTLSFEDMERLCEATHCSLCGRGPFRKAHNHPYAWSVDRIDARFGYVPGNVRATHRRCNETREDSGKHTPVERIEVPS
jgi:hypothetical protein